jgi:hypothetical protein
MAVTLQVLVSDEEQAYIVDLASKIAPGMTGPQLVQWAQGVCKKALKEEVLKQARDLLMQEELEAANEARRQFEAAAQTAWPEEQV